LPFEIDNFAAAFDVPHKLPVAVDFVFDDGAVDDIVNGAPAERQYTLQRLLENDILCRRLIAENAANAAQAQCGKTAHCGRL